MSFGLNVVESLTNTLWILIDVLIVGRVSVKFQHLILKVVDRMFSIFQEVRIMHVQEFRWISSRRTFSFDFADFLSQFLIPALWPIENGSNFLTISNATKIFCIRYPVVIMLWVIWWKFCILMFETDIFFNTLWWVMRLLRLSEFLAGWLHSHFHLLHHLHTSNISGVVEIEFFMSWKYANPSLLLNILFSSVVRAILWHNLVSIMIAETRLVVKMLQICSLH